MLSEDEQEAIEQLKSWREYIIKHKEKVNKANDIEFYLRIVLNLITKLQKENEEKDKQIDLMAEYWNTGLAMCDNCDKIVEKYEKNACKDCIKQYFETKAKKGE